MTPNSRFSLRFEAGERHGETVPIAPGGFVVGRRPGSSLQVLDSSLSGRHAELIVDDEGLLVRDLGSTNGTRINGERVLEQRASDGDVLIFGNVRFAVIAEGGAPAAPRRGSRTTEPRVAGERAAAGSVESAESAESVGRISADDLARAGRGSKLGWGALALLVVGGGAAFFLLRGGGKKGGEASTTARVVESVPGNLLADASFEEGSAGFESVAGPGTMDTSPDAARSGDQGLLAELAQGEWALAASPAVTIRPPTTLAVGAAILADSGLEGRVGLELLAARASQTDEGESRPGSLWVWSAAVRGEEFSEVEFDAAVPAGYDRARLVFLARGAKEGTGEGVVAFDDASIVPQQIEVRPVASSGDDALYLLGPERRSATLQRGAAPRLSNLVLRAENELVPGLGVPLEAQPRAGGARLVAQGASEVRGPFVLSARVESDLAADGIATLGENGYQTHGGPFERDGVSRLLIGGRRNLVELRFDEPKSVTLRPSGGGGLALEVVLGAMGAVDVGFEFADARALAGDIAHDARGELRAERLGPALVLWQRLLDEQPYDPTLVAEAEAERARLVRRGLEAVGDVRQTYEKARFFRLVDLFREAHDAAAALTQAWSGTEVGTAAGELAAEIETDVVELERDLTANERQRLERVRAALVAQGSNELGAEVGRYLEEQFR